MYEDLTIEEKTSVDDARKPYVARVSWPWMMSAFEVKRTDPESGYHFGGVADGLLRQSKEGRKARAQFIKYAKEIQSRQHRTHVFLFYISGMRVRVFRWDRTGAVATRPIDLKTNYVDFLNCVFRLAKLSKAKRGYDTSTSPATANDVKILKAYKPDNKYLKAYRKFMLMNQPYYPIQKARTYLHGSTH